MVKAASYVYVAASWMESGLFVVDRQRKMVRAKIHDPRASFKTTDLKPLFSGLSEVTYLIQRTRHAINLVDLRSERI